MIIRQDFSRQKAMVFYWLMIGCALVILMVLIGGITRLTQSGLSMVTWDPVMGIIPPLSEEEWHTSFDLYKTSPEFKHYNFHFALEDYKRIFFWEYVHRLLGRVIGLVFIIPFIIFWRRNFFDSHLKKAVLIILLLGAVQGLMGWLMVKSGLIDLPHVSHYRLAAHLLLAFSLIVFLYYSALRLKYAVLSESKSKWKKSLKFFFALVLIQIIFGAFVAGLKAGLTYNTFPKMGSFWIPPEFSDIISRDGLESMVSSSGIVQFIHRILAISIVAYITLILSRFKKEQISVNQIKALYFVAGSIYLQAILGVITLVYAVPVILGVAHQLMAVVILILCTRLWFVFANNKTIIHGNI